MNFLSSWWPSKPLPVRGGKKFTFRVTQFASASAVGHGENQRMISRRQIPLDQILDDNHVPSFAMLKQVLGRFYSLEDNFRLTYGDLSDGVRIDLSEDYELQDVIERFSLQSPATETTVLDLYLTHLTAATTPTPAPAPMKSAPEPRVRTEDAIAGNEKNKRREPVPQTIPTLHSPSRMTKDLIAAAHGGPKNAVVTPTADKRNNLRSRNVQQEQQQGPTGATTPRRSEEASQTERSGPQEVVARPDDTPQQESKTSELETTGDTRQQEILNYVPEQETPQRSTRKTRQNHIDEWGSIRPGSRIAIYWPDDDKYYPGTVEKQRGNDPSQFLVLYDDGEEEWIDLNEEKFRLLKHPPGDTETRINRSPPTIQGSGGDANKKGTNAAQRSTPSIIRKIKDDARAKKKASKKGSRRRPSRSNDVGEKNNNTKKNVSVTAQVGEKYLIPWGGSRIVRPVTIASLVSSSKCKIRFDGLGSQEYEANVSDLKPYRSKRPPKKRKYHAVEGHDNTSDGD